MNDLTTALARALERGENIQNAARSLINAGYSQQEIQEALTEISGKATPQTQTPQQSAQVQQPLQATPLPQQPFETSIPQAPQTEVQQKKKSGRNLVVIFLIIFNIVIILGAVIVAIFWESIMKLFGL